MKSRRWLCSGGLDKRARTAVGVWSSGRKLGLAVDVTEFVVPNKCSPSHAPSAQTSLIDTIPSESSCLMMRWRTCPWRMSSVASDRVTLGLLSLSLQRRAVLCSPEVTGGPLPGCRLTLRPIGDSRHPGLTSTVPCGSGNEGRRGPPDRACSRDPQAGTGIARAISVGDGGELPQLMGAAVAYAPALWVFGGVAGALFGLVPRAGF
jgi:hypothetical protein